MKKITVAMLALLSAAAFAQQKGTFTDTRDKQKYNTVKIGEQTWMAENLKFNAKGSKCYDNKPANCTKYGRLYNSETATSACPAGWHLPTDAEWNALYSAVGGNETSWKALKTKSGWNDDFDIESAEKVSGNGEDKFGFAALPGGAYGTDFACGDECIYFLSIGQCGFFSSASIEDGHRICGGSGSIMTLKDFSPSLLSVRCIKD